LYAAAFLAVLIALLVLGNRTGAREVFTHFEDTNGWSSIGTACFVGAQMPVLLLTGSDAAAHLTEETRSASRTVPKAIVISAAINYALGFGMLIALMFVLGDVDAMLETAMALQQKPWVRVVLEATGNLPGTVVVVAVVIVLCILATMNITLVASRLLFAFARDGGLPFSGSLAKVSSFCQI
jgi:choline transport protein